MFLSGIFSQWSRHTLTLCCCKQVLLHIKQNRHIIMNKSQCCKSWVHRAELPFEHKASHQLIAYFICYQSSFMIMTRTYATFTTMVMKTRSSLLNLTVALPSLISDNKEQWKSSKETLNYLKMKMEAIKNDAHVCSPLTLNLQPKCVNKGRK